MNARIQAIIEQHTDPWGIKVQLVEMKQWTFRRTWSGPSPSRPRLELVDIGPGRAKWIRTRLAQIVRCLERLEGRRQDVLWYFKNKWLEERGHLFE